jgi:phosphoribosylglycinamide formyltransferase-1
MKKNLVIFASGSGSNAVNVCQYFKDHDEVVVSALFCNNPHAGVIEKMQAFGVPVVLFNKETFANKAAFLQSMEPYKPTLIALLGFLWKVPAYLIEAYPNMLNLHPALLPKYGGKGMYGHHVHEAVKAAGETETGITIHWVNAHYDEGAVIAQFTHGLNQSDDADNIAKYIHLLEQKHVPEVIEEVLKKL